MMKRQPSELPKLALRLLARLGQGPLPDEPSTSAAAARLIANDLAARDSSGRLVLTPAGESHLLRLGVARDNPDIDAFRQQHLSLAQHARDGVTITVDESESPLRWLSRRKGRDGRPLIEPNELLAGERLRADFTHAQLTPRVTASWGAVSQSRRGGSDDGSGMTDSIIAARQRVTHAMDAVGPEMAGLVMDVCCFLKGLEEVERERRWPPRTAKIVLQLGLARLSRHYGYASSAVGKSRSVLRGWTAPAA
jgi:hypothetical protein